MTLIQFLQRFSSNEAIPGSIWIDFDTEWISGIVNKTKLEYFPEERSGNLCFAHNNADLQDAYKLSFGNQDLLNYAYGMWASKPGSEISSGRQMTELDVPLPKNNEAFWEMVNIGKRLRNGS